MARSKVRHVVQSAREVDAHISPDVADRELTCAVLGALETSVNDMAVAGWNAPPLCGPLYVKGRTPVGQQSWSGIVLEWHPLSFMTPAMAKAERPHHVLLTLAEAWRRELPAGLDIFPDDMIALVLLNEAWMVNADPKDEAAMIELDQASRDRRLDKHPQRMECKQAIAVDINGTVYYVTKLRGEKTIYQAGPAGSPYAIAGDVPNAIEYLLLTFQGKQLPGWYEWWSTNRDFRPEEMKRDDN